jgi:[NiFe] hydrogenase assembly HybE family chaperone
VSERIRKPALAPPPIRPAIAREDDPSAFLTAHYEHVRQTRMHDMPFVNPALSVETIGFVQLQGDWVGVVVTPWFINLFLVFGGGELWGDIPAGERRYLNLPCGTLQFIADDDPDIGPYQYCPLIAPVSNVPDMATARQTGRDAMAAVMVPPAPPVVEEAPPPAEPEKRDVSRRGFLRALSGRR